MLELFEQIEAAVQAIKQQWDQQARAGIILGTGLGSLTQQIQVEAALDYDQIPHFPRSTATSHRGRLVCGQLQGLPVIAMEGRLHMYEGYSLEEIARLLGSSVSTIGSRLQAGRKEILTILASEKKK